MNTESKEVLSERAKELLVMYLEKAPTLKP